MIITEADWSIYTRHHNQSFIDFTDSLKKLPKEFDIKTEHGIKIANKYRLFINYLLFHLEEYGSDEASYNKLLLLLQKLNVPEWRDIRTRNELYDKYTFLGVLPEFTIKEMSPEFTKLSEIYTTFYYKSNREIIIYKANKNFIDFVFNTKAGLTPESVEAANYFFKLPKDSTIESNSLRVERKNDQKVLIAFNNSHWSIMDGSKIIPSMPFIDNLLKLPKNDFFVDYILNANELEQEQSDPINETEFTKKLGEQFYEYFLNNRDKKREIKNMGINIFTILLKLKFKLPVTHTVPSLTEISDINFYKKYPNLYTNFANELYRLLHATTTEIKLDAIFNHVNNCHVINN